MTIYEGGKHGIASVHLDSTHDDAESSLMNNSEKLATFGRSSLYFLLKLINFRVIYLLRLSLRAKVPAPLVVL